MLKGNLSNPDVKSKDLSKASGGPPSAERKPKIHPCDGQAGVEGFRALIITYRVF